MIRELAITNLGVIANTRLEFPPGLTVLSGETGAGKTLITSAISQLLGAKPDLGLVRFGSSEATIDCVLTVPDSRRSQLDDLGALVDEDELLVTKTIGTRSRAIVGSRAVAAALLAEIVADSVTLHGQHGQTRLTRAAEQRLLLDATTVELTELLPIQRRAWDNVRQAEAALAEARATQADGARNLAELQAFVMDFESVRPTSDEDSQLDARIAVLTARDAIMRSSRSALAMLTEGDDAESTDVATLLARVRHDLEQRTEAPEFGQWAARAIEILELVQALGHDIDRYVDDLDLDTESLDEVMQRRSQIGSLLRRHGCTLTDLITRYESAARNIALMRDPAQRLDDLEALVAHTRNEQDQVCVQLHRSRSAAAVDLGARVCSELRELGLANASFSIRVTRTGEPTQFGDDVVEFQFSANPGQPEQPLASVGSGGELSRVMLALETANVPDRPRTFIFDEIDAGVGGRAALELGRRLAQLARTQQVVVVTHLAQVAAFADQHVLVEKTVTDGDTTTSTRVLTADQRSRELARMLSGLEDSASANAHAQELLDAAAVARRHPS